MQSLTVVAEAPARRGEGASADTESSVPISPTLTSDIPTFAFIAAHAGLDLPPYETDRPHQSLSPTTLRGAILKRRGNIR